MNRFLKVVLLLASFSALAQKSDAPLACTGESCQSPTSRVMNRSTCFTSTGRGCSDKLSDVVSVRDYGAKGDGNTNDTAAIFGAYNALTTGTILLPSGTYAATSVKLKPKLTYQGQGIESTTLSLGSTVGTLITSDVTSNSFAGMRDLTVRGDGATVGQKLLNVQGLFASHFDRVYFSSAENLVQLSSVEGQTEFRDCYFTAAGANGYGLRLDNVQEVIIENSPFENEAHGMLATITNAVTRLKFEKIHSENVGQLFNVDTATNNGSVSFRDINAFNVGANLADVTTGYAFRVNNEYAVIDNAHVTVTDPTTPVVVTPLWSIFARDCPSFTGADSTTCYIPHLEIGYGSAYVPNVKTPLLSNGLDFPGLYTVSGGAAVVTTAGTGAFSGLGQYRIRPLTRDPIANTAIMVRFEYRSTTAASETLNIDNMSPQMIGYSGSTVSRSASSIVLPSTAGVFTKVYAYVRFTGEFNQGTAFFYLNSTNVADTMEFRSFDVFAVDRPPYSLMDWGGSPGEKVAGYFTNTSGLDSIAFANNNSHLHLGTGTGDWLSSNGTDIIGSSDLSMNNVRVSGGLYYVSGSISAILRGNLASGSASAGATILRANTALSGATDKITCFQNVTTQKACVDLNGAATQVGVTFANIATGSTANGTLLYCSDCTIANPCTGAGTGAFAKRLNGVWVCN